MAMSVLDFDLMKEIQDGYDMDGGMKQIIEKLKKEPWAKKHYSWVQNVLRRKSKIDVPAIRELRNKILDWLHSSGVGGHSGRDATIQRVKGLFYWKGLSNSDVLMKEPELIVERKIVQRQGRVATMVSIKWSNEPVEEETWELLFDIQKRFPHFKP
ncbi:hypothetical protein Bca4012_097783 [Brassica carinata]